MTDLPPRGKRPEQGKVPNWMVLGAVGVFLVISGLLTFFGSQL